MLPLIKNSLKSLLLRSLLTNRRDSLFKNTKAYSFGKKDVRYIYSSNYVIVIEGDDGTKKYFREARIRLPQKEYMIDGIRDYFFNIYPYNNANLVVDSILKDLSKAENLKKLYKIQETYRKHFLEMCEGTFCEYDLIGMPCLECIDLHGESIHFIQFLRSLSFSHERNCGLPYGAFESFNTNRIAATRCLAELLNIPDEIPDIELCKVVIGDIERTGILMNSSGEESPAYISPEERHIICKSMFTKSITNLEYFDFISYQLDHRLDNYCVKRDSEKRIIGVSAFDNDEMHAFYIIPFLPKRTYAGVSGLVSKKTKEINRPYIDHDLYNAICNVSFAELKEKLYPYLTFVQITALWFRIRALKHYIFRTSKYNKNFVVSDWAEVDVFKELDTDYGITYMKLYWDNTDLINRINDIGG